MLWRDSADAICDKYLFHMRGLNCISRMFCLQVIQLIYTITVGMLSLTAVVTLPRSCITVGMLCPDRRSYTVYLPATLSSCYLALSRVKKITYKTTSLHMIKTNTN